ncbi:MAG: hypothetical protein WCX31_21565 [Salinivirgaceae bacterium]
MLNTELLPAQIIYLQAPKKVHVHDVIAAILQDLTLRRILKVIKINSFPNDRSKKTQKYFMFTKGESFEGYEPKSFEKSVLAPFKELEQVQAKLLTNFVLKRYNMPSGFLKVQMYSALNKEGYIGSIPILKSFGYLSLTAKGNEEVAKANEFITQQEEKLSGLIDGDKGQFYQVINETGTYVFHFAESNPVLYKNIVSMVKRINKTKPLGPEKDLTNFMEAMNIDISFLKE